MVSQTASQERVLVTGWTWTYGQGWAMETAEGTTTLIREQEVPRWCRSLRFLSISVLSENNCRPGPRKAQTLESYREHQFDAV
jgi:hypothetical protein